MNKFFKARRIVVTGGSGFLGSYVVEKLNRLGCENILIPRSACYDLREAGQIKNMYLDFNPDIVIHLAAVVGGIGANQQNPGKFFYDNLIMGVQLLEFARLQNIEKFVVAGTVCSYPKYCAAPFNETDLWDGYPEETNAPYGLAKKMLLVQSQAYRRQYGLNSIFLLPANLYGPRDNFESESSHVIPAIIRKCCQAVEKEEDEIEVWGDGSATREFLYAEDAAEAILLATEHYNQVEPVNIGTGQEVSIQEVVEKIKKFTNYSGRVRWNKEKPNGQPRRSLNTQRAKDNFGFIARTSFDEGLRRTVKWYKEAILASRIFAK